MLEDTIDGVSDQVLDGVQELFEVDEGQLAFDVRVLGQVATCARRLGSIGLRYAEHVAESRTRRFQIELRRLRKVGLYSQYTKKKQNFT